MCVCVCERERERESEESERDSRTAQREIRDGTFRSKAERRSDEGNNEEAERTGSVAVCLKRYNRRERGSSPESTRIYTERRKTKGGGSNADSTIHNAKYCKRNRRRQRTQAEGLQLAAQRRVRDMCDILNELRVKNRNRDWRLHRVQQFERAISSCGSSGGHAHRRAHTQGRDQSNSYCRRCMR